MARRQKKTRVLGPYKRGSNWQVVVIAEDGGRDDRYCATEEEAYRLINDIEEELRLEGPITVGRALEEYEAWQKARNKKKPASIATTMRRLRSLLPNEDVRLAGV